MQLFDAKDSFTYERLDDDSSITKNVDESIKLAEFSEVWEDHQTASVREQEIDQMDMVRDDLELEERVLTAKYVYRHYVKTALPKGEIVCRERVMRSESQATGK